MTWLDKARVHEGKVNSISRQLYTLATAFHRTGNEQVGLELEELAIRLEELADSMSALTSEILDDRLAEAQQATANMIGAALVLGDRK